LPIRNQTSSISGNGAIETHCSAPNLDEAALTIEVNAATLWLRMGANDPDVIFFDCHHRDALAPCAAHAKLKAPKSGTGLVIIELSPTKEDAGDYILLTASKRASGHVVQNRKMAISVNNSFPLYVDEATGRAWL
jgi:hypothetical protein